MIDLVAKAEDFVLLTSKTVGFYDKQTINVISILKQEHARLLGAIILPKNLSKKGA